MIHVKKDDALDNGRYLQELIGVICGLTQDQKLFDEFLYDLLTPKELIEISKRWQIVKLLDQDIPHHEIAKKLHTSVVTVSRGAREMQDPEGGFRRALRKVSHRRP